MRASIKFNVERRKDLAVALSEILGTSYQYNGAPNFEFLINGWVIDKNSNLISPENAEIETFITLKEKGFNSVGNIKLIFSSEGYTGSALRNIINMIYSKQDLLKKVFQLNEDILHREFVEQINEKKIECIDEFLEEANKLSYYDLGKLVFTKEEIIINFMNPNADLSEIKAYIQLINAIINKAKKQKFSSTKKSQTENEKYAFRVWLLRLGFIGEEFKITRNILLKNLKGNAAFR